MDKWNVIYCDINNLAEILSQLKYYGMDCKAYQSDNKLVWIIEIK